MRRLAAFRIACRATAIVLLVSSQAAAESLIAVASNFARTAKALEVEFESTTSYRVTFALGSTGHLYAQILNGAPYSALLAADEKRPALLESSGHVVAGSRFAYAYGQLALWSPDEGRFSADTATRYLASGQIRKLAIANPKLAPYGAAAAEVLATLGLANALESRLVYGENVGQAYALVATGNADAGLVARSYVSGGSRWDVPAELHAPVRQDAVLLKRGQDDDAARAFLEYLQTAIARELIAGYGYGLE